MGSGVLIRMRVHMIRVKVLESLVYNGNRVSGLECCGFKKMVSNALQIWIIMKH